MDNINNNNQQQPRRHRVAMNETTFNMIKKWNTTKSIHELVELTGLTRNVIYVAIRKIVAHNANNPSYESVYGKSGRKRLIKTELHCEIRNIVGNDNSLTQKGVLSQLNDSISLSQLCREFKAAGLSRKRLKRRSDVVLDESNISARLAFAARITGLRSKQLVFLDESGFNLHTSINYGYSAINHDAMIYQPRSRGRNISLCALIGISGVLNKKLIEGPYDGNMFKLFLEECILKNIFDVNTILVMDNVRFHHSELIKSFLSVNNIQVLYLPAYSPDLNPIENVFSIIKARLDRIRPRALTKNGLLMNIEGVMDELNDFSGL